MKKKEYYSLEPLLAKNATYSMAFGERSNGKSYAWKEYAIKQFYKTGKQTAIIRRLEEDFRGQRGFQMVADMCPLLEKVTKGEWNTFKYYSRRWYFAKNDEDGNLTVCDTPFLYGFALTAMEHDKSTNYPDIATIVFDEFMSRQGYLTNEFVIFCNVISTIARDRNDVKIFMFGNSVNRYCPYFQEMGLKHAKDMKAGDIDVYTYGDSGLTVAVEFVASKGKGKDSDVYFAFDNPRLSMITTGAFEMDIYPRLPFKYLPKERLFTFYVEFDNEWLTCDVVSSHNSVFVFVMPKTSEVKHPDDDLIYSPKNDPRPNWSCKITKPTMQVQTKILELFRKDKVFYATNECGEVMRNYLQYCTGVN